MRFIRLFIVLLSLSAATLSHSQISHGGTPYFPNASVLRVASQPFFVEMSSFNLDSVLREDAINKGNMRGSFQFAYKFFTHIDLKDIPATVLPDGTAIKQIGIRSAGAYSINLLLSDFEIPPGGKLFVYSADHSYVVGSFDYRNNSADKLLPIQPVVGESIIVEYSEPADVPFTGHFIITEVNHDYRDIFRAAGREPGTDNSSYDCMPDVFCDDVAEETIRATVLLIINGGTACTGSLLNNTSDDEKPYLLTAVHCLVGSTSEYPKDMSYYIDRAGTIITFFNYNRPVCDATVKMKGSEEMSVVGAVPHAILEDKDIALLELKESPPDYFNPYYAGWNRDLTGGQKEYTNIHHPSAAVAKYGMTTEAVRLYDGPAITELVGIDVTALWVVPSWTIGSTYSGSSGSPLFDENHYIVGGLLGGSSVCKGTSPDSGPDYFSSLGKGWETDNPNNQLKTYLDPKNSGSMTYPGRDPNQTNPVVRLANAQYTKGDMLITSKLDSPNEGFVFGNSNLKTLEFAEEFTVASPVEIFGTYILLPSMPYNYTSGVTISVYTGDSSPETKVYSTSFIPRYVSYSTYSKTDTVSAKNLNSAPTETFVVFDEPVSITKKFFISYSINNSTTAGFCVYNTKWSDDSHANTAWLKDDAKRWITADAYEYQPMKTSLAIQPLVRNHTNNSIDKIPVSEDPGFYYERSGRMLTLKEPFSTSGYLTVYSVGGQLLEKIQVPAGQTTFVLGERPKGTIGIVKIAGNDFVYTGKMMY